GGTEGWQVIQGTFNRTSSGGGAQGTSWYEASSANLDDQCDQIQSPIVSLTATSTMELWNQYDIEPFYVSGGVWYDRANIGVYELANGNRTPVAPSGGRLYNASGANGSCGTTGQGGWADAQTTWGASSWNASALGSAGFAGDLVQLDVRYGTDSSLNGFGFHFDQLILTDFGEQVADGQSDSCGCSSDPECSDNNVCNGIETCDIPSGTCQPGTPLTCDDNLFCTGVESCDPVLGCQAGTPPDCDDGVGCTVDSCNEGTDMCDNLPDDASCEDGMFCTGVETCDPVLDCQSSGDPCLPGEICNESTNMCDPGGTAQLESDCLSVGSAPVTVNLANTYASAVVTTSVQYENNTLPVVTRVSNVTATSFDVRLQNPSGALALQENVCYLVVEEGSWTIDGVDVEAQKYKSTVTDDAPSNWVGEAQTYGGSYTSPVVLGQVMSEADAGFSVFWDMATTRTNPPTATTLTTGKTVCEDTDVTRDDEEVGFIVIETGHGTIAGVEYEAATGADTVQGVGNAPPYATTFNTPFATAPTVAVVQMAAVDGNNGGWAQVHGPTLATTTTLNLSIDEDQITDTERSHITEQVAYVAFAGPVVYPPAPAVVMEWSGASVDGGGVTVNLQNTFTRPVIVTAVKYSNNTTPVVTRLSNVTGSSFDIRLQNPSGGAVQKDSVAYLVVEEGDWTVDGVAVSAATYNSTVTDENNSWVGEAQSYGQSFTRPVVLGQVMSSNDAGFSVFWDQGTARTNPPISSALTTGKTVCEDIDVTRADEAVGIVVIETGHGTLGGVEFEAALGADTVQGVGDAPPYAYTFNTPFPTAPALSLVTMAGVDGGNGGWAYVYGSSPTTTTTLDLAIDEDQIGDAERNHTTEQVGYVVFATRGSASP
ncbi:MAG: hypothetical protein GY713_05360, partial [Actinomycetia bacterium]|nr:hypothetical protein [Actinomycetes bacterium]